MHEASERGSEARDAIFGLRVRPLVRSFVRSFAVNEALPKHLVDVVDVGRSPVEAIRMAILKKLYFRCENCYTL